MALKLHTWEAAHGGDMGLKSYRQEAVVAFETHVRRWHAAHIPSGLKSTLLLLLFIYDAVLFLIIYFTAFIFLTHINSTVFIICKFILYEQYYIIKIFFMPNRNFQVSCY